MNFRFLHCLMFAFACVVGTGNVSVWADDVLTCGDAQYSDSGMCKDCPVEGTNAQNVLTEEVFSLWSAADVYRFEFVKLDESKCSIKLNTRISAASKCDEGTNVVYTYDSNTGKYLLDTDNYNVVPRDGYSVFSWLIDSREVIGDHCGTCDSSNGGYTENNVCKKCPTNDNIGDDKRFQFIRYGDGEGISSCAVKLDASKDDCNSLTDVVYVYNSVSNTYKRTKLEPEVFATSKSVIVNPLPAVDDMENKFCIKCEEGEYNIDGSCGKCDERGGYYIDANNDVCKKCPAGYYCPESSIDFSPCPANTYSEGGKEACTSCPMGYSTELSGPADDGYDGLCLELGKRCVSSDACKLTVSRLCIQDSCFDLPKSKLKLESLNRSVVQSVE